MGAGLERVEEMREQKAALLRGQLKAESAGVREALERVLGGQRLREEDGELLRDRQDDFARAIARGVTDYA